jgi:hypothetical protein
VQMKKSGTHLNVTRDSRPSGTQRHLRHEHDMARPRKSSSAAEDGTPPNLADTGQPSLRADLFFLKDTLRRGMSLAEVASFLRRSEDEVREKAKED